MRTIPDHLSGDVATTEIAERMDRLRGGAPRPGESIPPGPVTRAHAISLLDVHPARPDSSDPREHVPFVWACGPFGSWSETLDTALTEMAGHDTYTYRESFRLDWAVFYKPGWGFAAKTPRVAP